MLIFIDVGWFFIHNLMMKAIINKKNVDEQFYSESIKAVSKLGLTSHIIIW